MGPETAAVPGSAEETPPEIDANPTKQFFIEWLTKDITLKAAIIDLIDNCVDGARREARARASSVPLRYDGSWVRISMNTDEFSIEDNCGGIDAEKAWRYVFRFGRPKEDPSSHEGEIGQFGVGMKRALFKLGGKFTVESTTRASHFSMNVDVKDWEGKKGPWKFNFTEYVPAGKRTYTSDSIGTRISVRDLHEGIKKDFEGPTFVGELIDEASSRENDAIVRGLNLKINEIAGTASPLTLQTSEQIKPVKMQRMFNGGRPEVIAEMYAGLGKPIPSDAGWYIYCNGREILRADKTATTGWGTSRGVPSFHNQYNRFRGYLFFTSDDGSRLPWTTTKTEVEPGNGEYRSMRLQMEQSMRTIFSFLNSFDEELDLAPTNQVLHKAVAGCEEKELRALDDSDFFLHPEPAATPESTYVTVAFKRPRDEVEAVEAVTKTGSASAAGQAAFDHYYRTKCR